MSNIRTFYGCPVADGYYTTFDSSEVTRVDEGSEGGGGGGSSDFSTATVSIVNTNGTANLDFYGIVDNSYAQAMLKSDGDYLVSH